MRLAIAACCLLFSVLLSCLVFFYVQNVCKTLTAQAEALQQTAEGTEWFYEEVQLFINKWEGHSMLFCAFVHHKDADDLRQRFMKLQDRTRALDLEGVKAALEDCRIFLFVIAEGEKPNLANIL